LPTIVKTADTILCHGRTIQLSVSGGNSYSWQPSGTLSAANIANPLATPTSTTTYYFTADGTNRCSKADSIRIAVRPPPAFRVSDNTTACLNAAIPLRAEGGDTYEWTPANGLSNSLSATPLASPLSSTAYSVKIKSAVCEDSATLQTSITVLPLPTISATSTNDLTCRQPVTQLNAAGGTSYSWQPAAGLTSSFVSNPTASADASTMYIVKGTDRNGCSNYDSVYVKVTKTDELLLGMPNAFTPNGDGKNDCFGMSRYAGLFKQYELSIYNRFGNRVFYTTNPGDCWDGRVKGQPQDVGGFVYMIKANSFCGQILKKGTVMLLK
jgi:gliding motility-associated-like protein